MTQKPTWPVQGRWPALEAAILAVENEAGNPERQARAALALARLFQQPGSEVLAFAEVVERLGEQRTVTIDQDAAAALTRAYACLRQFLPEPVITADEHEPVTVEVRFPSDSE